MVKTRELQQYAVQFLAECFSTCILIFIGEGGIANYKFTGQTSHSTFPIAVSFGVGIYVAIMISGPISGAHLNPAVSISLLTIGKIRPLQCLFYIIGQLLGAFSGAALVHLVYLSQFNIFDGGIRQITGSNGTGDIFFTMPDKGISQWNTFIDQVVGTAFLMIFLVALTYDFNHMISEVAKPFAVSFIIIGIISAFSINAGAAINPARDFGPRLFGGFIYGWNNAFSVHNYYFYIPILGPIVGAIIGVWIYTGYTWITNHYGHFNNIQDNNAKKNINDELITTKCADDLHILEENITVLKF